LGHCNLEIGHCGQNQLFGHDIPHVSIDQLNHSRAWQFVESRGDGGAIARSVPEGFTALCNTSE